MRIGEVLTMTEYIEREATLKEVESAIMWGCTAVGLYEVIENTPAADVSPVRHGRWLRGGYACGETEWKCSVCNETEWRTSCSRLKYCPNCGCRMDGGDDE